MIPSTGLSHNTFANLQRLMPVLDKSLLQVISSHGSLQRASKHRGSSSTPSASPLKGSQAMADKLSPHVAAEIRTAMSQYINPSSPHDSIEPTGGRIRTPYKAPLHKSPIRQSP